MRAGEGLRDRIGTSMSATLGMSPLQSKSFELTTNPWQTMLFGLYLTFSQDASYDMPNAVAGRNDASI